MGLVPIPRALASSYDVRSMATVTADERGQRYIAVYKSVKGAVQLVIAASLAVCVVTGETERLASAAAGLRWHGAAAWSVRLGRTITLRHVELAAVALALDGALTSVEGWALRRGRTWGAWLVVVTTSVLLPFEVVAAVHHVDAVRILAFALNVGIVAFLARKAKRETMKRMLR